MQYRQVQETLMDFSPWSMSNEIMALVPLVGGLWPLDQHPCAAVARWHSGIVSAQRSCLQRVALIRASQSPGVPKNHLEGVLKHRFLGPNLRESNSVALGWGLSIWISNNCPDGAVCPPGACWESLGDHSLFIEKYGSWSLEGQKQTNLKNLQHICQLAPCFWIPTPTVLHPGPFHFCPQTGLPCPSVVICSLPKTQTTEKQGRGRENEDFPNP